jgi:hypothetical protein
MLSQFSAIQAIAAPRGDGLRPELLRLLEDHRRETEPAHRLVAGDALPQGVLRFPIDRAGQRIAPDAKGAENQS